MQTITPERDNRNKKLISSAFLWCAEWRRSQLLTTGTPEERDRFVKAQTKKTLLVLFGIGAWMVATELYRTPAPPAPTPTFIPAGHVVDVQLHDTTFSSSTTVTTSVGTYQVRGGVSAAKGDTANLKRTKSASGMMQSFLCLESKIKSGCYALL
ncbi:hypothetical protein [Aeromonas hydrophila]|uniref:hypothetical protein n=1 Tax=Aeromonas hydrophila TaxID=644 RepID=UPI002360389A|nr:hypothetical protein [Aeromonas hydrophila]